MSQEVSLMGHRRDRPFGHEITKWIDQVLGPDYHRYVAGEAWQPAVNLYEYDTYYVIIADLAGMRVEQIDLHVEAGSLALSGEREVPGIPGTSGSACIHVMEIDHGRFSRKLELPGDVEADAIEASYRCGYLWVRLPKKTR